MTEFGTKDSLRAALDRARLVRNELDATVATLAAVLEDADDEDTLPARAGPMRAQLGALNASLRNAADECHALAGRVQRIREGLRAMKDRSQQ